MAEFADTHDTGALRRSVASGDAPTTDSTALGETLRQLKRRGCSLLVTGTVPFETRAAMSRRLFGTPDEPRYRLLAVTNSVGLPVARYLPHGVTASAADVSVVDFADQLRGSTTASPSSGTGPTMRTDDTDRMANLGTTVSTAIERLAQQAGRFDAGTLRVGLASLRGPYDAEDPVRASVGRIVDDVVSRRGMVHCHLLDTTLDDDLMEAFDVRIELRDRGTGAPEHRWVVPDRAVRTEWVPL